MATGAGTAEAMTHYQDFTRDDGTVCTVEFSFKEGSGPSYSPYSGADGGDGCEVGIVQAFNDAGAVELTTEEAERFEAHIAATFFPDYSED